MKRKFEEILEECLSAHLEGRRSLQESLSLYPSMAAELEPLLRTAASVSASFRDHSPSPYRQEVGRQRFLAAASARVRARALTSTVNGFDRTRNRWSVRQWGLLGAAAAAVTVVVLVGLSMGGDGGSSTSVGHGPTAAPSASAAPEFVASIKEVQDRLNMLKAKATQGEEIEAEDIQLLAEATKKLAEQPGLDGLTEESKHQLTTLINEQIPFLEQLAEDTPGEQSEPVRTVLNLTKDLADKSGIPIFTTGATSAGSTPTPTPTNPSAETPTPAPTAEPTGTATPVETPSPSPAGSPDSSTLPTPEPVRVPLSLP